MSNSEPDAPASQRLALMFEDLARGLATGGTDCDHVAARFSSFAERHRNDFEELARTAAETALDENSRDVYQRRLYAAFAVITETAADCSEHPGAHAAFQSFDELLDPR